MKSKTDKNGLLSVELPEYEVDGKVSKISSPYVVTYGKVKKQVVLDSNKEIDLN